MFARQGEIFCERTKNIPDPRNSLEFKEDALNMLLLHVIRSFCLMIIDCIDNKTMLSP